MISIKLFNHTKKYLSLKPYRFRSAKYATHPFKFSQSQDFHRQKDRIPDDWDMIYKAPKDMDLVMNISSTYVTASTGLVATIGAYYYSQNLITNEAIMLGQSDIVLANDLQEFSIYLAAFIAIHGALRLLISKFALRLYRKGDNYIAVFRGIFYNVINKHEFNKNELKRMKPPLVVSWGDARFKLGKKKAIILEEYFKTPMYFNELIQQADVKNPL